MAIHTITVTYDAQTNQLGLQDPQQATVSIGPGDAVKWVFIGTPENCLAFVHFAPLNGAWFGPFQFLEPSPTGVVATGNNGSPATYEYTAMILGDSGPLTPQVSMSIINTSTQVDTSPHAFVSFNPNAEQIDQRVLVNPPHLWLEGGGTAIWHISLENFLPGQFVTFHFDGFPATPMIGPFQSFSLSPGIGGSLVARGAGFSSSNPVSYHIRVRNSDSSLEGSGDPVIEPLESPPGG